MRINLYFNGRISFDNYDKITVEKALTLPTGNVLPITVVKEKYAEYTATGSALTILYAEQLLEKRLLDRLDLKIGDGKAVQTTFETTLEGNILKVTLKAECLEQIASERPFTPEEIQLATLPAPSPDTGKKH